MKARLREIIFGTETPAGRLFDLVLIVAILASLFVVSLESVEPIRREHGELLWTLEWSFTVLFTVEYLLRLWCAPRPWRYARSFFGIVDLVSILPTWAALVLAGAQSFAVIRTLRLLRIFRVLKLAPFIVEASHLLRAIRASRFKVTVFLGGVLCVVVIAAALMYLIEGPRNGFTSIPRSMYWAVVTMTTVGYGDIAPQTPLGQVLASCLMIVGYGLIAVPTGIVSAELVQGASAGRPARACGRCGLDAHEADARWCRRCGEALGQDGR